MKTSTALWVCIVLLLAIVVLSPGCTTMQTACDPVEVKVPILVPCIKNVPPSLLLEPVPENPTDFDKIKVLSIRYLQQEQHINELVAIISGCL